MDVTFKYKNSVYTTPNLEKKLKKLRITKEDIIIISNSLVKEDVTPNGVVKYYYRLKDGTTLTSIYPNEIERGIFNVDYKL